MAAFLVLHISISFLNKCIMIITLRLLFNEVNSDINLSDSPFSKRFIFPYKMIHAALEKMLNYYC